MNKISLILFFLLAVISVLPGQFKEPEVLIDHQNFSWRFIGELGEDPNGGMRYAMFNGFQTRIYNSENDSLVQTVSNGAFYNQHVELVDVTNDGHKDIVYIGMTGSFGSEYGIVEIYQYSDPNGQYLDFAPFPFEINDQQYTDAVAQSGGIMDLCNFNIYGAATDVIGINPYFVLTYSFNTYVIPVEVILYYPTDPYETIDQSFCRFTFLHDFNQDGYNDIVELSRSKVHRVHIFTGDTPHVPTSLYSREKINWNGQKEIYHVFDDLYYHNQELLEFEGDSIFQLEDFLVPAPPAISYYVVADLDSVPGEDLVIFSQSDHAIRTYNFDTITSKFYLDLIKPISVPYGTGYQLSTSDVNEDGYNDILFFAGRNFPFYWLENTKATYPLNYHWTGSEDSLWTNSNNWHLSQVPAAEDAIVIAGLCPNNLKLGTLPLILGKEVSFPAIKCSSLSLLENGVIEGGELSSILNYSTLTLNGVIDWKNDAHNSIQNLENGMLLVQKAGSIVKSE